jgi:ABC-type branched-subunit amino acid transport system substrate-binding protein
VVIRRRSLVLAALALSTGLIAAACSNSSNSGTPATGSGVTVPSNTPGVTATKIVVGSLATESGILAGQFASVVNGAEGYFDYINAHGGVDGRKIDLAYNLDDTGSSTDDTIQARNLVEQDHVFAVVGVGTPFFSAASFFATEGTPTFGYVVTQDWNNRPTLFGAYGSYLDYTTSQPVEAYLAKQLHSKSVAVVAYNIAASSEDACAAVVAGLKAAGVNVGFEDLAFPYSGNPTADVLKMKAAHVDMWISCMAAADNLSFAKTMSEYGFGSIPKIWLNGYDRSYLKQAPSAMVGTIYLLQHVPFEAPAQFPGKYPAMATYLATMKKYQPADEYNDLSFQGYLNAVQFVQGLQELTAAHLPLTQANLVKTINKETAFSGGLTTPVNWTYSHSAAPPPYCSAFVEVEPSDALKVVFVQKNDEVFVCGNNQGQVVPAPPGTPGL